MQNDEIQEDETLQNSSTEEETEEVLTDEDDTTDVDPQAELVKARAEAKKWEAIAKRNRTKVDAPVTTDAPVALDQELISLTYKNYLTGLGISNNGVQDEAIALAKKMGMAISALSSDSAVMEILKKKQEIAVTNNAIAKGTGGNSVRKKDVDYHMAQVAQGKPITAISGKDAVALLNKMRG